MSYEAPNLPESVGVEVKRYVGRELQLIAEAINRPVFNLLTQFNVEQAIPDKPRQGMVAYFAAGVAGVNEGIYRYDGSAWQYVG